MHTFLKSLRKNAGYTTECLAKMLGISVQKIDDYESEKNADGKMLTPDQYMTLSCVYAIPLCSFDYAVRTSKEAPPMNVFLKNLREYYGYSEEYLAEQLRVTIDDIRLFESDENKDGRKLRSSQYIALARIYNIPFNTFLLKPIDPSHFSCELPQGLEPVFSAYVNNIQELCEMSNNEQIFKIFPLRRLCKLLED